VERTSNHSMYTLYFTMKSFINSVWTNTNFDGSNYTSGQFYHDNLNTRKLRSTLCTIIRLFKLAFSLILHTYLEYSYISKYNHQCLRIQHLVQLYVDIVNSLSKLACNFLSVKFYIYEVRSWFKWFEYYLKQVLFFFICIDFTRNIFTNMANVSCYSSLACLWTVYYKTNTIFWYYQQSGCLLLMFSLSWDS